MRVADKTGHLHWEEVDSQGGGRPEVDRIQLRGILLDSLPENAIQWGSKVRSITPAKEDGKYEIHIDAPSGNVRTEPYDLIIGADGAWSRVRPLLAPTKPHYSSISCLDTRIRSIDTKYPRLSALVGQGTYFAFSDHKGLIAQRNGDGSVRTYIMLQVAESWLTDVNVDWSNPDAAKEFLLEKEYADWHDTLKDLIRHADPDITPRALYALPATFTWPSQPGLTILGDAAHLMTPFAGEGVNLALLDALELAKAIINNNNNNNNTTTITTTTAEKKNGNDLAGAVRAYEEVMMERGREKMAETERNLRLLFEGDDAPRGFVRAFEDMMAMYGGAMAGWCWGAESKGLN